MMVMGYAQASDARSLQLWVGLFDTEDPPPVTFRIDGADVVAVPMSPMRPIRDAVFGPTGKPANHRGIFRIDGRDPGRRYRVEIIAGQDHRVLPTSTLPDALPAKLDGSFNILLCSCYYQPEDASGLLGTVASQVMLRPQLTMMLGDQIYGDLPLFEDLPEDEPGIRQKLGEKYRRNWVTPQLGAGGLASVLARAPVVCVADDHEYWNNFPFRQTQLPNTWTDTRRGRWQRAAQDLFEDYQLAGPAGGVQRIDIEPLSMLVVDMRSLRDEAFGRLVSDATLVEMRQWASDLIARKQAGNPSVGLLSSGQALFVSAASDSAKRKADAEMANYAQFEQAVMPLLEALADEGIPVVYVTGDVHWGRVAQGVDVRSGRVLLHEVIASPSRLIRVPLIDSGKEAMGSLRGIFGKRDPWPRHSNPGEVPEHLGTSKRFQLHCDVKAGEGHGQRGDHIAILSFSRAGRGVDFNVTYYAISTDKPLGKSLTTRTYELRVH